MWIIPMVQHDDRAAYEIAGSQYISSLSNAAQGVSLVGVFFNSTGTIMYVSSGTTIFQYSLSTAWVLSTATYSNKSFSFSTQTNGGKKIFLNSAGTKLFVLGDNTVYRYTLATASDISTATYDSMSFSVATQEGTARGMWFNSTGTTMYIVGTANDCIYQYALSTVWDLTTATYSNKSFSVTSKASLPLTVEGYGSAPWDVYIVDDATDSIYQYKLSTGGNITTASYSNSFSYAAQDTSIVDMFMKSDGTRMFLAGSTNKSIYQYDLV